MLYFSFITSEPPILITRFFITSFFLDTFKLFFLNQGIKEFIEVEDMDEVAIIGVGTTKLMSISPNVSYKELMFSAAMKACHDAGLNPRRDIDSFVCASEDFLEGISIFDEYVPDQLGGVRRSVCTVAANGLQALIVGFMQIKTGLVDTVLVEAHSKASEIVSINNVIAFALDPILNRPLGGNPLYIAGLEMMSFLHETGNTAEQCALVGVKNRKNALNNPISEFGGNISFDDALNSEPIFYPLKKSDISSPVDGACVIILASKEKAKEFSEIPIWIKGVGWCSGQSSLETRSWFRAEYASKAAKMAYKMAKIRAPMKEIHFAEINDTYSYKELQHLEELGICAQGDSGILLEEGVFDITGEFPINPSGGCLGMGYSFEMSGLLSAAETVTQLRGEAGRRQIEEATQGLVQSWRGIPTSTGSVVILSNGGE
jgi:acetyl-CoA C-acetyltransferase